MLGELKWLLAEAVATGARLVDLYQPIIKHAVLGNTPLSSCSVRRWNGGGRMAWLASDRLTLCNRRPRRRRAGEQNGLARF